MPSQLVYRALKINQQINDLQQAFFPIRWCFRKNKWIYGNDRAWKKYLFVSFLWKIVIAIPLLSVALQQMLFRYHQLFKIQHIFIAVFELIVTVGTVGLDILIYLYGREMIVCCNWCYETENKWMHLLLTEKLGKPGKKAESSKIWGNTLHNYDMDFIKHVNLLK